MSSPRSCSPPGSTGAAKGVHYTHGIFDAQVRRDRTDVRHRAGRDRGPLLPALLTLLDRARFNVRAPRHRPHEARRGRPGPDRRGSAPARRTFRVRLAGDLAPGRAPLRARSFRVPLDAPPDDRRRADSPEPARRDERRARRRRRGARPLRRDRGAARRLALEPRRRRRAARAHPATATASASAGSRRAPEVRVAAIDDGPLANWSEATELESGEGRRVLRRLAGRHA